jgi:hypothetical protein
MTDMQKRLSDYKEMSTSLRTKKFRPRKFDNTPRFNYGRGQAYGQNYGRGHGYRQTLVVVKIIDKTGTE